MKKLLLIVLLIVGCGITKAPAKPINICGIKNTTQEFVYYDCYEDYSETNCLAKNAYHQENSSQSSLDYWGDNQTCVEYCIEHEERGEACQMQ